MRSSTCFPPSLPPSLPTSQGDDAALPVHGDVSRVVSVQDPFRQQPHRQMAEVEEGGREGGRGQEEEGGELREQRAETQVNDYIP